MRQRIIINLTPITFHESTDQKKQCALRLMEIGNEHIYNFILISRGYNNLRAAVQGFKFITIKPINDILNGPISRDVCNGFSFTPMLIGVPLVYMQLRLLRLRSEEHTSELQSRQY